MRYPPAHRLDLTETIHGRPVADPYRWLEDPDSLETIAWSAAEDEQCQWWLAALPGRAEMRTRLRELLPGFVGLPYVVGSRRFFLRRVPGEEHAVLWLSEDGEERLLVDPSGLSADHTVTLDGWEPSRDGTRLAYQLSEGGDEESVLWVMDVVTGELLDGPIDRIRYSPIAWLPGGEALYYVRRPPADELPPGEQQFHRRVYLHRIGTDPAEDRLVFGEGADKTAYFDVHVSHDGHWITVTVSLGTAPRNDVYLASLRASAAIDAPEWHALAEGLDAQAWPYLGRDGRIYLLTDLDAPRRRLLVSDLSDGQPPPPLKTAAGWHELLAQDPDGAVLESFAVAGDALVAVRSVHATSQVTVHDRAGGRPWAEVTLPGLGTADVAGRPDEGPEVWVGYTDHVTPYRVMHLDPSTAELTPWADPPGLALTPRTPVRAEQVTYRSKDGTPVRMFVIAGEADAVAGQPRPTILYGYGGFNVPMTPAYSSSIVAWVEAGGVYAIANLRGGSEEGEAWHRDGMRDRKQNTFDDFAAAGDWLVEQGWTTRNQLGISGGSNGGLLVGATLTRRPDLCGAVVCSAPLLDMIRYEKFGLGQTWNDEYGRVDDPVEFQWLLSYSPYHHVVPGTPYPAVLFTVFEGDTRVDPLHARKMCAALQWATSSDAERRPVLLRRETKVGHGARSVTRTIELAVDQLGFLAAQLGLTLS